MEKLSISTSVFADGDRTEAFREIFGRTILRIDIEPLRGHAFESEMTLRSAPGLAMASGFGSPMRDRHMASLIDNDDLVLVFMQGGHGELEQNGRRTEVAEGQVALTANGEPATFASQTRTRLINLRLSRERLVPQLADIGACLRAPVLHDGPALRLLKGYANMVAEADRLSDVSLRQTVVTHLYDLATLAMGATRDASAEAKSRGVRAARLHAIKSDILGGLNRDQMSVGALARRHGISPGYVRQLFADEGITFTNFVLAQRLALAHRMLTGPRYSAWTISRIAFDCGFGDLSYFNRRFRIRYGATPSDIRAGALGEPGARTH